jgi:hypothetical protein
MTPAQLIRALPVLVGQVCRCTIARVNSKRRSDISGHVRIRLGCDLVNLACRIGLVCVSVVEMVVSFVLLILGMWSGGVLKAAENEASNLLTDDIPS